MATRMVLPSKKGAHIVDMRTLAEIGKLVMTTCVLSTD